MDAKLISLVVPVLNEQGSVQPFLARALPALEQACALAGPGSRFEIVFVNDGSTDLTQAVLLGWRIKLPQIEVVGLSRNFGKDAALAAGLAQARGDCVIPIDIDLQEPPEVIPQMVEKWLAGALIVNGVRASRGAEGIVKRASARWFYKLYNALAEREIPGNVGDFRLIDRQVVDILNALPERSRFTKGLLPWIGFSPQEVVFERAERASGVTKWKYWKLWNFAIDGLTSTTTAPLRVWTYIGLSVAAFSFLYGLFLIGWKLFDGSSTPGYTSMMTAMLFLNGMTMLSIGILGEYVGRIATEVRGRPLFIINDINGTRHTWNAPPIPAWPPSRAATGGSAAAAPSSRPSSRAM